MRLRTGLGIVAVGLGIVIATSAFADAGNLNSNSTSTPENNITFPVAELGNCADAAACHAYCDIAANMQACTTFAENHGLENSSDAKQADQFAKVLANGGGPGGCSSPDSCDAYCSSISHLDTCITFAKAHNLGGDKITQGEKMQNYLKSGGHMPGNCDSQSSCEAYCSDESHQDECMKFAEEAGLPQGGGPGSNGSVSPEMQQKFDELLQSGKTPSGCQTLTACETYCSDPSHGSDCGAFGEEMGVQGNMKVSQPGPGGCTSDAACKTYCSDPTHATECQQFGKQEGQKGSIQAGPGGCNSDASCQAYCSDPAHATECQTFGHQSNYVEGSSTPYGNPAGCGEDQYWNGSACVSSGPACQPGQPCTPPPCPPGQICNFNSGGGEPAGSSTSAPSMPPPPPPSPQGANILSVFSNFVQALDRVISGR